MMLSIYLWPTVFAAWRQQMWWRTAASDPWWSPATASCWWPEQVLPGLPPGCRARTYPTPASPWWVVGWSGCLENNRTKRTERSPLSSVDGRYKHRSPASHGCLLYTTSPFLWMYRSALSGSSLTKVPTHRHISWLETSVGAFSVTVITRRAAQIWSVFLCVLWVFQNRENMIATGCFWTQHGQDVNSSPGMVKSRRFTDEGCPEFTASLASYGAFSEFRLTTEWITWKRVHDHWN